LGFKTYTNADYAASSAASPSSFEYGPNVQSPHHDQDPRDDSSIPGYASTYSALESEGTSEEPEYHFSDDRSPNTAFATENVYAPEFVPPPRLSKAERREIREQQQLDRRLKLQRMEAKISTLQALSKVWFEHGRDDMIQSMTDVLDQVIDAVVKESQVKEE